MHAWPGRFLIDPGSQVYARSVRMPPVRPGSREEKSHPKRGRHRAQLTCRRRGWSGEDAGPGPHPLTNPRRLSAPAQVLAGSWLKVLRQGLYWKRAGQLTRQGARQLGGPAGSIESSSRHSPVCLPVSPAPVDSGRRGPGTSIDLRSRCETNQNTIAGSSFVLPMAMFPFCLSKDLWPSVLAAFPLALFAFLSFVP